MPKVKRIIPVMILFVIMIGVFIFFFGEKKSIKPTKIIEFSEIGLNDFTCTGLTYDRNENVFWIADFGRTIPDEEAKPRLVAVNQNTEHEDRTVSLAGVIEEDAHLQGIAYDSVDDSLWSATGGMCMKSVKKAG